MNKINILDEKKENKLRTWIEISKSAIDNNISQYKKIIGDKILAPVIKSNAYGHGMIELAKICAQNKNIDWLCVANADEAIILRENEITKNLLVLSYVGDLAEQLIDKDISFVVYDLESAIYFNSLGKILNKKANLHVKIDTGLSRAGLLPEEAIEFIKIVKNLEFINIQGIWTHFAESENTDIEFTNSQVNKFNNIIEELNKIDIKIQFIHSSNSAGTLTVNSKYDNFFRPGRGIYGYWSSENTKRITQKNHPDFKLIPCMTWKTKIFSIKNIPSETFVSYNRTFKTKRNTKLAIIPVGYYDGYEKNYSNANIGHVIINEIPAKIIGTICMNVMVIDITGIENVKIGDHVILIGNVPYVNIDEMAKNLNINPIDISTKIKAEIQKTIVD